MLTPPLPARFYTLLVLSTALFDKPPFKNLIANGMVLAADGQKMSKRKKNYPDPMLVRKTSQTQAGEVPRSHSLKRIGNI